jgi:hypothetical protein
VVLGIPFVVQARCVDPFPSYLLLNMEALTLCRVSEPLSTTLLAELEILLVDPSATL